jgi:ribosomal protein S18 acetylase RimI-like enzyme
MVNHQLTVLWNPSHEETKAISDGLTRFGMQAIGGEASESLAVLLKARSGEVIGGATGRAILGHFHLDQLWVTSALREMGHGSTILKRITQEAYKLGCREIRLDTMNPRSVPFYEKHGFEVLAEIPEYLPGFKRIFYRKRL